MRQYMTVCRHRIIEVMDALSAGSRSLHIPTYKNQISWANLCKHIQTQMAPHSRLNKQLNKNLRELGQQWQVLQSSYPNISESKKACQFLPLVFCRCLRNMLVLACASPARVADCTITHDMLTSKMWWLVCCSLLVLHWCHPLCCLHLEDTLDMQILQAGATPFRVIGSERLRCTEMLEEDSWITDLLRWTSCAVPSTWPKAGEQLKRCTARIEVLYILAVQGIHWSMIALDYASNR